MLKGLEHNLRSQILILIFYVLNGLLEHFKRQAKILNVNVKSQVRFNGKN